MIDAYRDGTVFSTARSDPHQPFTSSFSFLFSPLSTFFTAGLSCLSRGSSCEMQGLPVRLSGDHLVLLIVNESFTFKITSKGCYSSVWLTGSSKPPLGYIDLYFQTLIFGDWFSSSLRFRLLFLIMQLPGLSMS